MGEWKNKEVMIGLFLLIVLFSVVYFSDIGGLTGKVVSNPGFESDSSGWVFSGNTVVYDTIQKKSGLRSLKITNYGYAIQYPTELNNSEGKSYVLKFWAKKNTPSVISSSGIQGSQSWNMPSERQVVVDSVEWKEYSLSFKLPVDDADLSYHITLGSDPNNQGVLWYDDVSLTEFVCGDGTVTVEQCDDGDGVSGDGCSSSCMVESGYTCSGSPSICYSYSQQCSDSDVTSTYPDGLNYYSKGTLSSEMPILSMNDICSGSDLTEYYCSLDSDGVNRPKSLVYSCPNGCSDGACILPQTSIIKNGDFLADGSNWDLISSNSQGYGVVEVINPDYKVLSIPGYGSARQNFSSNIGNFYNLSFNAYLTTDNSHIGAYANGTIRNSSGSSISSIGVQPLGDSNNWKLYSVLFRAPKTGNYYVSLETTPQSKDKSQYVFFDNVKLVSVTSVEDICVIYNNVTDKETTYDLGDRQTVRNSTGDLQNSYCNSDGEWVKQRDLEKSCSEDYQCLSNICDDKKCSTNSTSSSVSGVKCSYGNNNYTSGMRFDGKYCSSLGSVVNQKTTGQYCSNNYECASNSCDVLCKAVNSTSQGAAKSGGLIDSDNEDGEDEESNNGVVIFWTIFIFVFILVIIIAFVTWSSYQRKHFDDLKKKSNPSNKPGQINPRPANNSSIRPPNRPPFKR
jgi:cysteine-rich repeat protein